MAAAFNVPLLGLGLSACERHAPLNTLIDLGY